MNKIQLIAVIANDTGLSKKDVRLALDGTLKVISTTLSKGDKVKLEGFGSFIVRSRGKRVGRNPQTGQTINLDACKVAAFKASKALKEAVNT